MYLRILFLLTLFSIELSGQCYLDRHSSIIDDAWLSCQTSANPNSARGESHWILYEFDETYNLGIIQLWNINSPDHLTSGVKQLIIDYTTDGVTWEEWGTIEIDMGPGSTIYEGVEITNLDDLSASGILLTLAENHGGDCFGFAEVKIETNQTTSTAEELSDTKISITPNPTSDFVWISTSDKKGQVTITDITGQTILTYILNDTNNNKRINVSQWAVGQYLVTINTGLDVSTQSFNITKF